MNTHDDALEPTPQDFGFPSNPTRANQECWDRQQAFLEAYRHTSLLTHAAKAVGVSVYAVDKWLSRDVYSFKKRMEMAHREYCDWVRGEIQNRLANPKGNRGSDVLLMFESKAMMPELYREEVKVLNSEAPLRMLEMLKELGKRELEQTVEGEYKELPAPAAEGEYREVPTAGPASGQVVNTPPQSGGAYGPPPEPPPLSAKERRIAQVRAAKEARTAYRPTQERPVNRR